MFLILIYASFILPRTHFNSCTPPAQNSTVSSRAFDKTPVHFSLVLGSTSLLTIDYLSSKVLRQYNQSGLTS